MITANYPAAVENQLSDQPHKSGDDRYAIYAVRGPERRRLCETSRTGIGEAILTMFEEDEYDDRHRIGILDRLTRRWIVNPWAKP